MSTFPNPWMRAVAALAAAAALSSCASFSRDGGFGRVATAAQTGLDKTVRWPRTAQEKARSDSEVSALLSRPLSADDAVQVALLNNRGLQAAFEELGISEADLVQSGRVPNPRFTFRHAGAGGLYNIEETLTFNILSLLTVPYAHAAERRRFAQTQDAVILQIAQLAARTRIAYYTAVAARDSLSYAWQIKGAADTANELATRMVGTGNWSRLHAMHERVFFNEALQDLDRARLAEKLATSNLLRLLALTGEQPLLLIEHLPELPVNIVHLPELETIALRQRIDLQLMQIRTEELARRLKLTQATRFVNVLDAGPTRVLDGTRESPYQAGYEVSLQIPIFDSGAPQVRKAEAIYAQAVERFEQAVIDARSEVRSADARYGIAYEMAVREHDDVQTAYEFIAKQNVLRYNASHGSVFDLLGDARAQIASVRRYIDSLREFWIARCELDAALIGAIEP